MTTDTHSTALRRSLVDSVDRGVRWLVDRIADDGNPGAAGCHWYRVPWTLALAGRRAEAAAVLSWVEREALDDRGDLREGPARGGFERRWASYPLAILASGAWHLERYDTAARITTRLRDYRHPDTGGAFAAHPDHRIDGRQDLVPTAQLGMTGITTGRMDLADGAARWMRALWEAQPELPRRLYTATDGTRLITDVGDDAEAAFGLVTDFDLPRQAFYNPGIAAAFLGRYAMATGDEDTLQLARDYIDLTVGGSESQFDHTDSVQVCKFGWGAAVLLETTGDETLLPHVVRMGHWFTAAQNPDGSWDNSPFLMERPSDHESVRVEITAEFVQHLTSIINALAGWHRRPNRGDR